MPDEGSVKICFVAPNVYPLLSRDAGLERVGGAELQQIQIGRALRDVGFSVSYISLDHGQEEAQRIDHFTIYKAFSEEEGIRGLRFLHPRITKLWRALYRADADVYYCRAAGFIPGLLAFFCGLYRKKFVFAGASDTDFIPGRELIRFSRDRYLYRFGLRRASAVIAQSNYQAELLWSNYRLKGVVIKNFFDGRALNTPSHEQREILWVSTLRQLKRPLLFVELARTFPGERFIMIGGPDHSNPALYDEVKKQCEVLPNFEFLGFQSLEKTEEHFDRCKVFVNTSEHEGFPNTFLQAWRRGIPVVSYVDPDGLIRQHRLGFSVENQQQMEEAIAKLLASHGEYHFRITEYFRENHSGRVIDKYCLLLKGLVDAS
jgi:glycosyltransferase involved in cell wall biosynthesis